MKTKGTTKKQTKGTALRGISDVFTAETVKALNDASVTADNAIALAAMDAAKVPGGMGQKEFVREVRLVCALRASTAVFSAALSAAKVDGATLASVVAAIAVRKETDRVSALATRKAKAKDTTAAAGAADGAILDVALVPLDVLTARAETLRQELDAVLGEIARREAKAKAAAETADGGADVAKTGTQG